MSAAQHTLKQCHSDIGYSWEGDVTCHLLILYFMVFELHCNNFLTVILEGDAGSASSVSQQGGGEQSFQAFQQEENYSGIRCWKDAFMVYMVKTRGKELSSGLQLSLQYLFTLYRIIIRGVSEGGHSVDRDWSGSHSGEVE